MLRVNGMKRVDGSRPALYLDLSVVNRGLAENELPSFGVLINNDYFGISDTAVHGIILPHTLMRNSTIDATLDISGIRHAWRQRAVEWTEATRFERWKMRSIAYLSGLWKAGVSVVVQLGNARTVKILIKPRVFRTALKGWDTTEGGFELLLLGARKFDVRSRSQRQSDESQYRKRPQCELSSEAVGNGSRFTHYCRNCRDGTSYLDHVADSHLAR
jgi:hypothetical protein